MTQKEFVILSHHKTIDVEDVEQAWRAGYIYAQELIREYYLDNYQDEFFERLESFISDNLSEEHFEDDNFFDI